MSARKPCKNCPFRVDVKPYIRGGRAMEIADALQSGGAFPCHNTLDYDDSGGHRTAKTKFCAGALGVFYNEDDEAWGHLNQMVRIENRLGMLSDEDIEEPWNGLTYESFSDFVDAHRTA